MTGNATNTRADVRRRLVDTAHDYGLDAAAVVMTAALEQCVARNAPRPANRRVPDGSR
ncbi:AAA family ATPase [Streptomyces sp. NPDC006365]|uniref:AAA family ATPase n=1 Tax=Streptomyces sp. NPDC006365 TaxID=3364744 RepID=UPI0036C6F673